VELIALWYYEEKEKGLPSFDSHVPPINARAEILRADFTR